MKVLGIIPSRYESTRFPGKPLVDLKGKTMIRRVYEGASRSEKITHLAVATDDVRIFDEVVCFNGNVYMTKPEHQSGTDRCAEVAAIFENVDVVVNIQGDEPLVDPRQLDQLIEVFEDPTVQIATLGHRHLSKEDLENPNRIKIVTDASYHALYFSRSCIPNHFHFKEEPLAFYPYMRHIGLYAYRPQILNEITLLKPTLLEKIESLEQLRWLYYGYKIKIVETDIETPNIDVPEDVEKVLGLL